MNWSLRCLIAVGIACMSACQPEPPQTESSRPAAAPTAASRAPVEAHVEQQVTTFCGACHQMARPEFFPQSAWPDEIQLGFDRYFESRRTDLSVPVMADAIHYFQSRAPARLDLPASSTSPAPFARTFVETEALTTTPGQVPGTAHVESLAIFADRPPVLVACDMRDGAVRWLDPLEKEATAGHELVRLRHPCRAAACDWDRDGAVDLLIADLGSFDPADHDRGRVIWLRQDPVRSTWTPIVLADGLGRVANVRPADLDGDGDDDLVVAEFGWRKSGSLFWLENQGVAENQSKLIRHELDPRAGVIDTPVVDLNGDGRPDIVALVSQHYEEVVAYLNQGEGRFAPHVIGPSQDPAFGSSGIELVDLDGDADLDVLYSNGDTFDSKHAKPYHGIQWLENRGEFPFISHRLADLVGAYRAAAGDLDGDGDLDILASSFLPRELLTKYPLENVDSLIVLEQTTPGQFRRHSLKTGDFAYATLELRDYDRDGDLDAALGVFQLQSATPQPRIRLLWNSPRLPSHSP